MTQKKQRWFLKKKLLPLRVTVAVLLIAVGFSWWYPGIHRPTPKQRETTPEVVKIGFSSAITTTLARVAEQQGYYRDEGVNVQLQPYPSGKRAMKEGLFTGKMDMIISGAIPVILNRPLRKDYAVVASISSSFNLNQVIARKDRGIAEPKDLKGKRVATQRASSVHFFLHLFLIRHGLTLADIQPIYMKAEKLPAALASGKIDAFSMREPFISQAQALLDKQTILFSAPGLFRHFGCLVAKTPWLIEHQQTVQSILRVLIKAEQFVTDHPQEAMRLVAAWQKMALKQLARIWPELTFRVSLSPTLSAKLVDEARWAKQSGLFTKKFTMDFEHLIHVEALTHVAPGRVSITEIR